MVIAFIHAASSFLPELTAYQRFFRQRNIETLSANFRDAAQIDADVFWYIMGFSMRRPADRVIIHEYTSASAPPYAACKDAGKRMLNAKPDFRLFLNEYVKCRLSFHDNKPYGFRDMGVDRDVFKLQDKTQKEYDFIYVGNLHHTRGIDRLLHCFGGGQLRDRSLLILSRDYNQVAARYSHWQNIHFAGPVEAQSVADYINRSSFALNYIPDISPYHQQTSTKFLEYAACNIPIITTNYPWIKQFQQHHGGNCFFLEKDLSNFSWDAVNAFTYSSPDISGYDWHTQIRNSGILNFLAARFQRSGMRNEL